MRLGMPPPWPPEDQITDADVRFAFGRAVEDRVKARRNLEDAERHVKRLKAEMHTRGLLPSSSQP